MAAELYYDVSQEQIETLIKKYLPELTFFRARTISVSLLTKLYDLPYSNYHYDKVKNHWTKKISKILKRWEQEGKLVIYRKSRRGNLYKRK